MQVSIQAACCTLLRVLLVCLCRSLGRRNQPSTLKRETHRVDETDAIFSSRTLFGRYSDTGTSLKIPQPGCVWVPCFFHVPLQQTQL